MRKPRAILRWSSMIPLNLLCLSSRVERGLGAVELAVDLAGEVALQAAADFRWGSSFGGSFLDVGAGAWVVAEAAKDDKVARILAPRSPPRLNRASGQRVNVSRWATITSRGRTSWPPTCR